MAKNRKKRPKRTAPKKVRDHVAEVVRQQREDAPTQAPPQFKVLAHSGRQLLWLAACLGLFANWRTFVENSPTFDTLASRWLQFIEWPWQRISGALGIKFFPEVAVMMTCIILFLITAYSARYLEDKHTPRPQFAKEPNKAKARVMFKSWWTERYVQGIVMGTTATAVFVIATEYFVLGGSLAASVTRVPLWYWTLHIFALVVCVPSLFMKLGQRHTAQVLLAGAVCGGLIFLIWLPSASKAATAGTTEVNYFRWAVLDYSIVRMSATLAGILAVASPIFLWSQMQFLIGAAAIILGSSWWVTSGQALLQ